MPFKWQYVQGDLVGCQNLPADSENLGQSLWKEMVPHDFKAALSCFCCRCFFLFPLFPSDFPHVLWSHWWNLMANSSTLNTSFHWFGGVRVLSRSCFAAESCRVERCSRDFAALLFQFSSILCRFCAGTWILCFARKALFNAGNFSVLAPLSAVWALKFYLWTQV